MNPNQSNLDEDVAGDVCDVDIDGDVDIIGSEFRVKDNGWNDKFKVDYSGDVYMNGNNNYISGGVDVSGNADFHGDVSGDNQPTQNEHLNLQPRIVNPILCGYLYNE